MVFFALLMMGTVSSAAGYFFGLSGCFAITRSLIF
jgi:hypothetical protein